jgi:hypothetical protein
MNQLALLNTKQSRKTIKIQNKTIPPAVCSKENTQPKIKMFTIKQNGCSFLNTTSSLLN